MQRLQFGLLQRTTPSSSSDLNLALVSRRLRFGVCLVVSKGLFFMDLRTLADLTLSILLLMNWKSIVWLGLCVITRGMISVLSMLMLEEVFFILLSLCDRLLSSTSAKRTGCAIHVQKAAIFFMNIKKSSIQHLSG